MTKRIGRRLPNCWRCKLGLHRADKNCQCGCSVCGYGAGTRQSLTDSGY